MHQLDRSKLGLDEFKEKFNELSERLTKEAVLNEKNRDNIITLENYVERYIPMQILKTLVRVVRPILEEPARKDLDNET